MEFSPATRMVCGPATASVIRARRTANSYDIGEVSRASVRWAYLAWMSVLPVWVLPLTVMRSTASRSAPGAASKPRGPDRAPSAGASVTFLLAPSTTRSEEHTSELQSLMRISYAVFCLKKNKKNTQQQLNTPTAPNSRHQAPYP